MKKILISISILLVFFLSGFAAEKDQYQLITKSNKGVIFFDVKSIKEGFDKYQKVNFIDVLIKYEYNLEGLSGLIHKSKLYGISPSKYKSYAYTIYQYFLADNQICLIRSIDYAKNGQEIANYIISRSWKKFAPNSDEEKIYKAVTSYYQKFLQEKFQTSTSAEEPNLDYEFAMLIIDESVLTNKVEDYTRSKDASQRTILLDEWEKCVRRLETNFGTNYSGLHLEKLRGDFYRMGYKLGIDECWEKAETYYKKALQIDGKDMETHLLLGILYFDTNIQTTVKNNNNKKTIKYEYKRVRPELIKLAEREFNSALKIEPGYHSPYTFLFFIYYFEGRFKEAVEMLDKYLKFKPEDKTYQKLRNIAKNKLKNKTKPKEINMEL